MSRAAAVRTAAGGVLRHKVQAIVIAVVLLASTASATLGLALLAASSGPFDHAFAAQHGADIAVTVNSSRASAAELPATRALPGVTAAAGPFAETTVQVQQDGQPSGQCPPVSTRSSMLPPGEARPARVSWPNGWPSC